MSVVTAIDSLRAAKPRELKPTYPLDVEQVRTLRQRLVLDSPKLMAWQLLAQLGSRFTLLSRFSEAWAKLEPQMNSAVVEHVVKQSNHAQNQVIRCFIDVLKDRQRHADAETLSRFLLAKQTIELALKTNRRLAGQRADVETIVDSIMQEVCNELELVCEWESALAILQSKKADPVQIEHLKSVIERSRKQISDAYDVLIETQEQTTFQQAPASSIENWTDESKLAESDVLDKLIGALRDENEFAKAVNERLSNELPDCE